MPHPCQPLPASPPSPPSFSGPPPMPYPPSPEFQRDPDANNSRGTAAAVGSGCGGRFTLAASFASEISTIVLGIDVSAVRAYPEWAQPYTPVSTVMRPTCGRVSSTAARFQHGCGFPFHSADGQTQLSARPTICSTPAAAALTSITAIPMWTLPADASLCSWSNGRAFFLQD